MKVVFISNHESAEVLKPSKESFDFPPAPVSSQGPSILGFGPFPVVFMRSDHVDSPGLEFIVQWVAIVGLVPNDPLGKLDQETALPGLVDQGHFMGRSAVHVQSGRKTRAVCYAHDFRAFAPLGFTGSRPPFFAGANVPSMKVSRISMPPRFFKSSARAMRISSKTPPFDHFWNQRWQVWYGGYRPGRSFQGAPVLRIQRIPLRTSRGARTGRPRPPG